MTGSRVGKRSRAASLLMEILMRRMLICSLSLGVLLCGCGEGQKPGKGGTRQQVYTDKTPEEWIQILRHRDPRARQKAVDALVQYGDQVVPAVIEVLKDRKLGGSRLSAARALGALGPGAEEAVPAMIEAMQESDWPDRDGAVEALGQIRRQLDRTVPALIEVLAGDGDERVRAKAAQALGRIRADGAETVAALAAALEDPDVNVRAEAAEALEKIGPGARAAVPALEKAARTEDFILKQAAQEALKAIRGR